MPATILPDSSRSTIIRTIHFISGLPRSGSTLLSALLKQNPAFHASMSSPVHGMAASMMRDMSAANEYAVFIKPEQRLRVLRGIVENYYGPEYTAQVIIDTNRGWCAWMPQLNALFPESRVIACVRNVSWIVDSIERLAQRNALSPSGIFNYQTGGTVYSRAEMLANGDGLVGFSYNALKEAFYGPHANKLLLVQYETMVTNPARVLEAVYRHLGQAPYPHDFNNVAYEADEFDMRAGTPGLHSVRSKIEAIPRQTVLPPDVFNRFGNDAFWLHPQANLHGVQVI